MKTIVISQPMLFPWVGLFEQIRLADLYVHYSDVQFSKGSFVNRVQIKTAQGSKWLTVPLHNLALGQRIDSVQVRPQTGGAGDWRRRHLDMLKQAYKEAPFKHEMFSLVETLYSTTWETIGSLSLASIEICCDYFGLSKQTSFIDVKDLGISGSSSQRVFDIVQHLEGGKYVTGLGARHYLDHELFEKAGILVEYMDYQRNEYPQRHGRFDPHVSILDLIANMGQNGLPLIRSKSIPWRETLE
ncbi:MAG: WbqC family protein [Magnetococcales bacterium]|nr:WbqC family protein [Magnetococcales bacterium]